MALVPQRNPHIKRASRSLKKERFAKAYALTGSRKRAAKAAGIPENTGGVSAMLKDVDVRRMIAEYRSEALSKIELTGEAVLRELMKIGFANMQDYVSVDENGQPVMDYASVTRDQAAAMSEITVDERVLQGAKAPGGGAQDDGAAPAPPVVLARRTKFKLHDKRAALETLGKHLGLFEQDPALKDISVGVQVLIKNA